MTRTQFGLTPPDFNGIGQENVGAGQVNLHFCLRFLRTFELLRKQGLSMASASQRVQQGKEKADP
jgi:hypothetical protein